MSGPPDPSRPDQYREMIRSEVSQILSDPLQLPDELTAWLTTFVQLTADSTPSPAPAPAAAAPPPPGKKH